jgi:flavin-binding protein dodecin
MPRTVTKRVLSIAGAAVIGGLLSLSALAQIRTSTTIKLVGSSPNSWEAAKNAVEEAGKHLADVRIAEVDRLDMRLESGKVVEYRAGVRVELPK